MRYLQTGITINDTARATPGFTLFSPLIQKATYLIDMDGNTVHQWDLPAQPGNYCHMLENGNLLTSTKHPDAPQGLAACGGLFQELDWDGNVVWQHEDPFQHHDFARLANGNTLYIGWELLPEELTSRIKGGQPNSEKEPGIWGDNLREVDADGNTVWEWHLDDKWDFDKFPMAPMAPRTAYAHANALCPLANGDIMVTFRMLGGCVIIDRESKLVTWSRTERQWMGPHNGHELDNGNFMVFGNGAGGTPPYTGSAVIEYDRESLETVWKYQGYPAHTFSSPFISGAQRLDNGHTLICEGMWGRIFEVTADGEIVWEFISPHFVPDEPVTPNSGTNSLFRAYRYAADSPQIQGRL